jgi:hypothetical protein
MAKNEAVTRCSMRSVCQQGGFYKALFSPSHEPLISRGARTNSITLRAKRYQKGVCRAPAVRGAIKKVSMLLLLQQEVVVPLPRSDYYSGLCAFRFFCKRV